jgi:hypothetical protein
MIILTCIPSIVAFASLLASKSKLTIYFSCVALVSLALTAAFTPFFSQSYLDFVADIPLMRAFRESIHWMFFVILSYSILMGITISALCRRFKKSALKALAIGLTAVILLATTYPLFTGDVSRNWINPESKGSYFPNSYVELNDMMSSQYWGILLPKRYTYVIYNFSKGLWECGNPYPLMFSNPVISGTGTEYTQPRDSDLINNIYDLIRTKLTYDNSMSNPSSVSKYLGVLGIRYLILEKNIISGYAYQWNETNLTGNKDFVLDKEWDEVELFHNAHASPKIYCADRMLNYTTFDDMYRIVDGHDWNTLARSTFVDAAFSDEVAGESLTMPVACVWKEKSPTSYEVRVISKGPFILVFLEDYDSNWRLRVNDRPVSATELLKVNAYANGWIIRETGDLRLTIVYEPQNTFEVSVIASVALSLLIVVFINRKILKELSYRIQRRLGHEH